MNKAITDGVVFMPTAFEDGLNVWSSGNGTSGSDTYDTATNAVFVPADQDFGGCLELQKVNSTQKLRYTGQTPIVPGCYLQVRVKIKAISGSLPSVRIAAWAGDSNENHVSDLDETGPSVALTSYGEVVEVTAIVGSGTRGGVDMVWGTAPVYGHFGLDLIGASGGVVRIDDVEIVDVSNVFLRDMLGVVDVRDFGAVGDGVTDDSAAFEAADEAAGGRRILVPEGEYFLGETVTLNAEVDFEGTIEMPTDKMLLLLKDFGLPSYIAAFGSEELAFRKAFQALLNNADHDSLDLGGRKIKVTGPIDMQAAVPNKTSYATRRVIRNGQLEASESSAWDTDVFTSQATYSTSDSRKLSNVSNAANIPVGCLVEGNGVGREVYVRSVNAGAQEITLSAPLYDAAGTQTFTFRSFKYMLDFSGFESFSKFGLSDVELQCEGECSAIRLSPSGSTFNIRDCFISRPKDRGVTSIGGGCQGMLIDQCQFLSSEDSESVATRTSIAVNANANDVKFRHNRSTRFLHCALFQGSNTMIIGNHLFQGDDDVSGVRSAGVVLSGSHSSSTISGNYVDNCLIEWTNEHDPTPDHSNGFSFSALSITDNIFLAGSVANWFAFVVIKPYGVGHYLNGVTVTGNKFRCINGSIERADRVDTSFAGLDFAKSKNVTFEANTYHNVSVQPTNPLRVKHNQGSTSQVWTIDSDDKLPFGAFVRRVDSVVAYDEVVDGSGDREHGMPQVRVGQGSDNDQVKLVWPKAVKGDVSVVMRIDL
ncbi:glycosyl hydrolase family 28-related protein [Phaeobacter marinintestinus]|uniref:glycosyl hydrolase family 28-related protein n=1 Tax=Falsiphaeobacter marinintestinus TaxID=1492905 RepID=UPI0011B36848|nr:glycosyl hydrolase family 28-related protein [Phaeobacter marinintestinus]